MSSNGDILLKLVEEDSGIRGHGRWFRSEKHSSLVVDYENGVFFFNAQGIVGDPLVYLVDVRGYTLPQAREHLKNYDYGGTFVYNIRSNGKDTVVYPQLVHTFFEMGLDKRDYFYARGLTDETINRFQLGFYNDFYLVPFFDSGVLRNFQMRQDKPSKRIKGYYSNIGPLLFNSDVLKFTDDVYYVEGPVDAMVLIQNGIPAVSSNCGGGYLSEWFGRFARVKSINLVFDNDDGGRKESTRLAKFLGTNRTKIYTFQDYDEKGYDPVDFFRDGNTAEDFINLVKEGSRYVFEL